MKKFKPCEICKCEECKTGKYRTDSWYCPMSKKQICEVCCYLDTQIENPLKCMSLKCKHYRGE